MRVFENWLPILLAAAPKATPEQPQIVKAADEIAHRWAWLDREVIAGNQVWRLLGLATMLLLGLMISGRWPKCLVIWPSG